MIGGILFLSCLSDCLLLILTFTLTFEPLRDRDFIWNAYTTIDVLSNDSKVNDHVTLTLAFFSKNTEKVDFAWGIFRGCRAFAFFAKITQTWKQNPITLMKEIGVDSWK